MCPNFWLVLFIRGILPWFQSRIPLFAFIFKLAASLVLFWIVFCVSFFVSVCVCRSALMVCYCLLCSALSFTSSLRLYSLCSTFASWFPLSPQCVYIVLCFPLVSVLASVHFPLVLRAALSDSLIWISDFSAFWILFLNLNKCFFPLLCGCFNLLILTLWLFSLHWG